RRRCLEAAEQRDTDRRALVDARPRPGLDTWWLDIERKVDVVQLSRRPVGQLERVLARRTHVPGDRWRLRRDPLAHEPLHRLVKFPSTPLLFDLGELAFEALLF